MEEIIAYTYELGYYLTQCFNAYIKKDNLLEVHEEKWQTLTPISNMPKDFFSTTLLRRTSSSPQAADFLGYVDNVLVLIQGATGAPIKLSLAGVDDSNFELVTEKIKKIFPPLMNEEAQVVNMEFWYHSDMGARARTRQLSVPSLKEIKGNYTSGISAEIEKLANIENVDGGKLILWSGHPGTGKTYALRALAWQWRSWCNFKYLVDPESFFGHHADDLLSVILDDDDEDDNKWSLIILEDTGEMLSADAKDRVGQGLSRLLNLVDGLLGQGLKILVLITTNEEVGALHPAIIRSGRCLQHINFEALPEDQSQEWLLSRGNNKNISGPQFLSDLYGIINEWKSNKKENKKVGFI